VAFCKRTAALDPRRLIFLDESAAQTNLTRLYGRAPIGQRCFDHVPGGHFSTYTLLTALRLTGPITASTVLIDGTVNACVFMQYIERVLAPMLRRRDIVVMDNLAAHKGAAIGEAIDARGAQCVYLPPY
jgi:hypothetical protein